MTEMRRDMPEIRDEIERWFAEETTIMREMSLQCMSTGEGRHLSVRHELLFPDLVLVQMVDTAEPCGRRTR